MRGIRKSDDSGAALVFGLIIITVLALVVGAVVSLTMTSERTTTALRNQAGVAYNGDGAVQAAINNLRTGYGYAGGAGFNNVAGSSCFGSYGNTLSLANFYPATGSTAVSSAAVVCAAEPGTGDQGSPVPISSANKPGNAVLTMAGQTYGQSNKPVTIHGGIVSNSTIDSTKAQLIATGNVQIRAAGACSGSIKPACTPSAPAADPNYPPPTTLPAPPASLPACTNKNKLAEFQPGLYTNADIFNNCKASWILFSPGTYYFDFTSGASHTWTIDKTVVGGTLTTVKSDTPPAVPGACLNPINSTAAVGVTLVFGGDSQLFIDKDSQAEFCATYTRTSIPTVLYGLKADVGTGANIAHAQSGCILTSCDLISNGANGTKPNFFFEGFVYAPRGNVDVSVNNSSQPYFNFGLIVRNLDFSTTGSACTPPACQAFISLPDNSPGYGIGGTIVNLTAYVCPGVNTGGCATDAARRLAITARVQLWDPSGSPDSPHRQVTVLSWSTSR